MIKKYKKQLIISSVVILLPILVGLGLWTTLPDRFATHWGFSGDADGWSSKATAIFAGPLLLLATHWFCFLITTLDPKSKAQTPKAFGMIFWFCPVISLCSSTAIYSLALGYEFNMTSVMFAALALMFILMGNYMPKCKHNYTLGIKTPWALASEENWNATHRFGGKVWVIGGAVILPLCFLPHDGAVIAMLVILLVLAFLPVLYSYQFYKKQRSTGVNVQVYTSHSTKWVLLIIAVVLIALFFVLFTGSIDYEYGDENFTVTSDRWETLTVRYDAIEAIEYRDEMVSGSREWGYGSARLLMGTFKNEEFGDFIRYTYADCDSCVVLRTDDDYIVLSGEDAAQTQAIYDELIAKTEG